VFDHVTIRVSDLEASKRFYELVFGNVEFSAAPTEGGGFVEWNDFSISQATDDRPVTRRLHTGFVAPSREHVDAFWRRLTAAGYRDDGPPGERRQYRHDYYGAFVLDPDGNSVEAVHHGLAGLRSGVIDHLWLRVADLAAAKRFYETIAPTIGYRLARDSEDRAGFGGRDGSFTVTPGDPSAHVHLAFPVPDRTTVETFHRVATEAGYRDNGPPGERPEYHPGYFGAYVLDPDGNNVEAVFHNRSSA
jgi:catechol 2,3-dioxygenase-like lactoylglutathione lyase family enzyme